MQSLLYTHHETPLLNGTYHNRLIDKLIHVFHYAAENVKNMKASYSSQFSHSSFSISCTTALQTCPNKRNSIVSLRDVILLSIALTSADWHSGRGSEKVTLCLLHEVCSQTTLSPCQRSGHKLNITPEAQITPRMFQRHHARSTCWIFSIC